MKKYSTVTPKKGKALLWPSTLDSDPEEIEARTMHEARPVIKGLKYAGNIYHSALHTIHHVIHHTFHHTIQLTVMVIAKKQTLFRCLFLFSSVHSLPFLLAQRLTHEVSCDFLS